MLKFDKVKTRNTVVLQIYQQMKRSILRGELPTGYRIVEANIAEAFGVSRTPVREAISRLIAQGFIKEQRNVKIVADISVSMSEINGIRLVLESYAARLAAQNATDEDLKIIAEYCNSSVQVDGSSTIEKRASLNDSFHESVALASYNERLIALISDFYEYALTEEMLIHYSKSDTEAHAAQHRSILKALCDRDPDAAENAMRAHITSISQVVEQAITQMKAK